LPLGVISTWAIFIFVVGMASLLIVFIRGVLLGRTGARSSGDIPDHTRLITIGAGEGKVKTRVAKVVVVIVQERALLEAAG
jgi:hypothetical protein